MKIKCCKESQLNLNSTTKYTYALTLKTMLAEEPAIFETLADELSLNNRFRTCQLEKNE